MIKLYITGQAKDSQGINSWNTHSRTGTANER